MRILNFLKNMVMFLIVELLFAYCCINSSFQVEFDLLRILDTNKPKDLEFELWRFRWFRITKWEKKNRSDASRYHLVQCAPSMQKGLGRHPCSALEWFLRPKSLAWCTPSMQRAWGGIPAVHQNGSSDQIVWRGAPNAPKSSIICLFFLFYSN